ncbi:Insulin-degrading enzyme-like protein [Dinothrombium tinctorium]|uniref:Insulin-degrading enzyme-like protein n=1 Tax=Dinothrombium tinctorium TaxID=1965070 RepID=A0A3S3PJD0_9ACAR|nr:Insulin-degrading enzyme-like protein [Dinothrombium tinctorium]
MRTRNFQESQIKCCDGVAKVHGNILKSVNDKWTYEGLTLENGLKIILISDPTTEKAAAALDINVGSMSDPWSVQGLAHFLEHMLFLGTKKFPDEHEFDSFISRHGGDTNAFTSETNTKYFFDIAPSHLDGALQRFVEFFIAPLLTENSTDREMNAVNSEHQKALKRDSARTWQVIKASANQTHDFAKFNIGNLKTLKITPNLQGIDVRKELLKFHDDWYSSNLMCLAVLGKEPIEKLKEIIVSMFKNIENLNITVPVWNENPFGVNQLKKEIHVVPIRDIKYLKPAFYVSHLLGHESAGSLLSYLKMQELCTALSSEVEYMSGFGFFYINIELTDKGIMHTNDIIKAIFQYIKLLKSDEPQIWIFNEMKNLSFMEFRFKEGETPYDAVYGITSAMQKFPMEDVLSGNMLMQEFRPDLIKEVLRHLNPDNMIVVITGRNFEGKTNRREKWYGVDYNIADINENFLNELRNINLNKYFHLPLPNEFIPTKFGIKKRETSGKMPKLLRNSDISRVWFLANGEYLVPRAFYGFSFSRFGILSYLNLISFFVDSPLINNDPLFIVTLNLFKHLVDDSLGEYIYNAKLAGFEYEIKTHSYGFFVSDQLYGEQMLTVQSLLTLDKLKETIRIVLSKLSIQMIAYGNLDSKEVNEVIDEVENRLNQTFSLTAVENIHSLKSRMLKLPDSSSYIFEDQTDIQTDNGILVMFQINLQTIEETVKLQLLEQILSTHCFNILRTKEQLGYSVSCLAKKRNKVLSLEFAIQSSHPPEYLDQRIESFISWSKTYLANLSNEEFKSQRHGLLTNLKIKPKHLKEFAANLFAEIKEEQYLFDRQSLKISELEKLSKSDVIDFFNVRCKNCRLLIHAFHLQEYIDIDGKSRKKLSIRIKSTLQKNALKINATIINVTKCSEKDPIIIEDINRFKSSLATYPLNEPYMPNCKKQVYLRRRVSFSTYK